MAVLNNTQAILAGLKGEGNKIYTDSENPTSFEGWNEGDIFINTTTKAFYTFDGSSLVEQGSLGASVESLSSDELNEILI